MQHIQLKFTVPTRIIHDPNKSIWTTADLVDMIATIQEGGARDLWRYEIEAYMIAREEKGIAERIGWLDVPSQPRLKGDWTISLRSHSLIRF